MGVLLHIACWELAGEDDEDDDYEYLGCGKGGVRKQWGGGLCMSRAQGMEEAFCGVNMARTRTIEIRINLQWCHGEV